MRHPWISSVINLLTILLLLCFLITVECKEWTEKEKEDWRRDHDAKGASKLPLFCIFSYMVLTI